MNPRNRTFIIVGAVVALIIVVAGIAIVASGGDDDNSDASVSTADTSADTSSDTSSGGSTAGSSDGSAVEIEQNRPIEPTGEPLPPFADPEADAAVGMASPVIVGQSFDGTPITIGGPSDGPTLLVFLAHWCPHCNAEIPELVTLNDAGDIPADLNVVGISTAVASDRPNYPPSKWIVGKDWPWPTLADDTESNAFGYFGGTGFPTLVMLDADGAVLARQSGEGSASEIKAWIDSVLATANG